MSTRDAAVDRAPVAITGLGLVTPIGLDWPTFRRRIWRGTTAIGEIDVLRRRHAPSAAGAQVRDFRLADHASPSLCSEVASLRDRRSELGCAAMLMAADDARIHGVYAPDHVGVVLGTGATSYNQQELSNVLDRYRTTARRRQYLRVSRLAANPSAHRHFADHAVHRTADALGFRGARAVHSSTCAASAIAVLSGLQRLRRGDLDACLVGGFDASLTPVGVSSFALLGALSTSDRPPGERLRPFDRNRDGVLIGEGAVVFVLERLASARERGAAVLGELLGAGASMDAHSILAPCPSGAGAALAIRRALADAGVSPGEIDYVNAHGTATSLNDPAETRALKAVFGRHAKRIPVSSSKPYFGHLLGASGAIELVVTLAALRDQMLPPTLNLHDSDPECDLDYVPLRPRPARVRIAASNSFGFGGYNACLVLRETPT